MSIRTAFVLGAGLGTRLRPLTDVRPKPLIPIYGKPLITFALDHLAALGVENFVINTHHLAPAFDKEFASGVYGGRPVRLVFEPDILETGGGIKNAEPFLGDAPFIVYSGDILTDIDLEALVKHHMESGNDVTLALRKTGLASHIAFDPATHRVIDIRNRYGHEGTHDFANVSIWNPSIFARIPARTKISFIPIIADWIPQGGKIGGVVLEEREWFNIGSRKEYLGVHKLIRETGWKPAYLTENWPLEVAPDAKVAESARLQGFCSLGKGCVVGENAVLEDSILWPEARISDGAHLGSCVVTESLVISGEHSNVDFT